MERCEASQMCVQVLGTTRDRCLRIDDPPLNIDTQRLPIDDERLNIGKQRRSINEHPLPIDHQRRSSMGRGCASIFKSSGTMFRGAARRLESVEQREREYAMIRGARPMIVEVTQQIHGVQLVDHGSSLREAMRGNWLSLPNSWDRSPQHVDVVLMKRLVLSDDASAFHLCLRNDHPVERVAMMERKIHVGFDVRNLREQKFECVLAHLLSDQRAQRQGKSEFSDVDLDRHLPQARRAHVGGILHVGDCPSCITAQTLISTCEPEEAVCIQ